MGDINIERRYAWDYIERLEAKVRRLEDALRGIAAFKCEADHAAVARQALAYPERKNW